MKIAICDDNREICEQIAAKLRSAYPNDEIRLFENGLTLLMANDLFDILFLDIQMPGRDGMQAAKELRARGADTAIIFITAVEEYVFQAFDVGAFHYLVKPFSTEKLMGVFQKAKEQRQGFLSMPEQRQIVIQRGGVYTKVLLRDIIYAEVFNRKVLLHTVNGEIEYYGKLSDLEAQAGQDFFRTHRAYLVHFKYVERYDASTVILADGQALIAKQSYSSFVREYLKYVKRVGGNP